MTTKRVVKTTTPIQVDICVDFWM